MPIIVIYLSIIYLAALVRVGHCLCCPPCPGLVSLQRCPVGEKKPRPRLRRYFAAESDDDEAHVDGDEEEEEIFDLSDKGIASAITEGTVRRRTRNEDVPDEDNELEDEEDEEVEVESGADDKGRSSHVAGKKQRKRGSGKRKPSVVHVMFEATKDAGAFKCLLTPFVALEVSRSYFCFFGCLGTQVNRSTEPKGTSCHREAV